MKIKGSVFGPGIFGRASWPFGSINIDQNQIIFKGFPFTNETVAKGAIQKIEISTIFNGFRFNYQKDGKDRHIEFSPLTKEATMIALKELGYMLS